MPETSGQNLDLAFLYEIADGSNEFIVESIDMFLQHTPALLQEITGAADSANWPVAAAAAHKLKPNLGFFGMLESQAQAQELEYMTKSNNPNDEAIKSKIQELQTSLVPNLEELGRIKTEAESQL